jgi:hypothetical protein
VIFIERDRLGGSTQEELDMSNNFTSHFSADDAAPVLSGLLTAVSVNRDEGRP